MYKQNPHPEILCFRAFDMRDHFPQPIATFREALELLQSDRAYLPEDSAQITCYLKSGESIQIPDSFYLKEVPRFQNEDEARKWVLQRMDEIESGTSLPIFGLVITDPKLPIEDQVKEALAYSDTEVIDPSENDRVCAEVNDWLNGAISAMPANRNDDDFVDFIKAAHAKQNNPARWVITCRDYGLTDVCGNAYFDMVNGVWVPDISDASCVQERAIADAVVASFDPECLVSVVQHFISQKELAKTAIKFEQDPKVITYHPDTETYLYQEHNFFSDFESHAMISMRNPEQFAIEKVIAGSEQLLVSIPDTAMDEVAIAWCQHRKLQGALGGPVGKEWGSPDCDYD